MNISHNLGFFISAIIKNVENFLEIDNRFSSFYLIGNIQQLLDLFTIFIFDLLLMVFLKYLLLFFIISNQTFPLLDFPIDSLLQRITDLLLNLILSVDIESFQMLPFYELNCLHIGLFLLSFKIRNHDIIDLWSSPNLFLNQTGIEKQDHVKQSFIILELLGRDFVKTCGLTKHYI